MWWWIIFFTFPQVRLENCLEPLQLQYRLTGNVSLSAIFDVHESNCSALRHRGLVEAAAIVWAVNALNYQRNLPNGTIGLDLYDGCSEVEKRRRALIETELCTDSKFSVMTTKEIEKDLKNLSISINRTFNKVEEIIEADFVFTMLTDLMKEMNINTIHRMIADSTEAINSFGRRMTQEGICLYDLVPLEDINAAYNEVLQPTKVPEADLHLISNSPCVIIVYARSEGVLRFLENLPETLKKQRDIRWFFVPSDFMLELSFKDIFPLHSYILSAVTPDKKILQTFLQNPNHTTDIMNHRAAIKTPFFLSVAYAVLSTLSSQRKKSEGQGYLTGEKIQQVIETFYLTTETEMFLFTVFDVAKNDDIAVFRIFDKETALMRPLLVLLNDRNRRSIFRLAIADLERKQPKEKLFRGEFEPHPCYEPLGNLSKTCGICLNFVKYLSKVAQERQIEMGIKKGFRYEIWVGINISLAFIVVLCSLSIIIFIFYRMFRADVLEGSPYLSILLLLALIFGCLCTLPYSFYGEEFCDYRMLGPPIGYNLIFSILLARSFMLASSDREGGFMSHVNGYLQTIHFLFLFLVQLVFSLQNWFYNPGCSETRLIYLHTYDGFLLILLVAITPFTYKSKRNYKEGFYFAISIFLTLVIWVIWIPLYLLLPHKDATVSLSLTITVATVLSTIFIPRTYLMVSSIVRDQIVSTLPPFRSTQNLYQVSQKVSSSPQILPGEYFASDCSLMPPTPSLPEHVYDSTSSPNRVTRF